MPEDVFEDTQEDDWKPAKRALNLAKKASSTRQLAPIGYRASSFLVRQRTDGENSVTRRVLIKSDKRVHFVKEQEIIFVEAAGNYVHISLGSDSLLTRNSLNRLGSLLSAERFVRIHRSAIVNLDQICHLEPLPGGEYVLTLHGGKQLKASRRHVGELMRSIKGNPAEENSRDRRPPAVRSSANRPKLVPRFY